MKFLEDAQKLVDTRHYLEALEILNDRIDCRREIKKERLAEYYCLRCICLASVGDILGSTKDYQAILSWERRKTFGRKYKFLPDRYIEFVLEKSGAPKHSKKYLELRNQLLCSSIDDSCFENMGMPDHIIAQVRNVARSKSRKPNLSDCIDQGLSKHQLTKSIKQPQVHKSSQIIDPWQDSDFHNLSSKVSEVNVIQSSSLQENEYALCHEGFPKSDYQLESSQSIITNAELKAFIDLLEQERASRSKLHDFIDQHRLEMKSLVETEVSKIYNAFSQDIKAVNTLVKEFDNSCSSLDVRLKDIESSLNANYLDGSQLAEINSNLKDYMADSLSAQEGNISKKINQSIDQCQSEMKSFVQEEVSRFEGSSVKNNQTFDALVVDLKSSFSALDARIRVIETSLNAKASLKRVRGHNRSLHRSLNKSHDELVKMHAWLRSYVEALSERTESLFSTLKGVKSEKSIDSLLKSSQQMFLSRLAFNIPPMRILALGSLASSGFFFTQFALNSFLPNRVSPYANDPSSIRVSLPYPIQKLRQMFQEKFLIDPQKSEKIIRRKYPEFYSLSNLD